MTNVEVLTAYTAMAALTHKMVAAATASDWDGLETLEQQVAAHVAMLRGSEEVLDRLCDTLGVQPGGTTTDGKITLEFAECLGGCEGAPCLLINDEQRMNVTTEKVDALIEELRQ